MLKSLKSLELVDPGRILGEGSFSRVLKVRSRVDGRFYALKSIDLRLLSDREIDNLNTEITLHRSLRHPNIVTFVDHLYENDHLYILLEHSSNGCLFFYIHSADGLSEPVALRVLYQVANATSYLHSKGIIHRDLKPENILLDENFNVKVCDFGWSSLISTGEYRQTVCGTFEYMAPEMLLPGSINYNHKLDVWCMGILMFEILHGQLTRQPALFGQQSGGHPHPAGGAGHPAQGGYLGNDPHADQRDDQSGHPDQV